MTTIGECLRRERLRRNLQLEQISKELKISARMLAAIEAEDFGKLPGGVFTKNFVRQYAHLLGLDEADLVSEIDRVIDPLQDLSATSNSEKHERLGISLPRMEAWESVGDRHMRGSGWTSSLPALMLVVVVMMVCAGIYAFWQRPQPPVSSRPAQQARQVAPTAPPAASVPSEAPSMAVPAAESRLAQTSEAQAGAGSTAPPAAAASQQAAPVRTVSASLPPPAGPVHVEVTATQSVWVRAVSDGKYVFSGILAPNETRTIDGKESVVLRLGNAGGVTILLNGKPIGEVGPRGQIRNVQLSSGGFQVVAPPKSEAPALDTF